MRTEPTAAQRRIGRKLRKRRDSLHLTAKQVADISGLCLRTISLIETGYEINYTTLNNYVLALGGIIEINFPEIKVDTYRVKNAREYKKKE